MVVVVVGGVRSYTSECLQVLYEELSSTQREFNKVVKPQGKPLEAMVAEV